MIGSILQQSSRLLPILSTIHCCISLTDYRHGERIDKIINCRVNLAVVTKTRERHSEQLHRGDTKARKRR